MLVKGKGLESMEGKEASGPWCIIEPSSFLFTFWNIVRGSPSVAKKKFSPFRVEGSLEDGFQNIVFLCESVQHQKWLGTSWPVRMAVL